MVVCQSDASSATGILLDDFMLYRLIKALPRNNKRDRVDGLFLSLFAARGLGMMIDFDVAVPLGPALPFPG